MSQRGPISEWNIQQDSNGDFLKVCMYDLYIHEPLGFLPWQRRSNTCGSQEGQVPLDFSQNGTLTVRDPEEFQRLQHEPRHCSLDRGHVSLLCHTSEEFKVYIGCWVLQFISNVSCFAV